MTDILTTAALPIFVSHCCGMRLTTWLSKFCNEQLSAPLLSLSFTRLITQCQSAEKNSDGWDVRAEVTNPFNADAREPAFYSVLGMPSDLLLPGRAFYIQLQINIYAATVRPT